MSFDPEGDRRRQKANDLYLMGRALVKNGDLARAHQLLQQAVENDPDLDQAWVWLTAASAGLRRHGNLRGIWFFIPERLRVSNMASSLQQGGRSARAAARPAVRRAGRGR